MKIKFLQINQNIDISKDAGQQGGFFLKFAFERLGYHVHMSCGMTYELLINSYNFAYSTLYLCNVMYYFR